MPAPLSPQFVDTLDVLCERWSLLIVREVLRGVHRFGQLQRALGVSRNVLTDRLRKLEALGVLERRRYRDDLGWSEYRLTERGLKLCPAVIAVSNWASEHLDDASSDTELTLSVRHRACGRVAEGHLVCTECGLPVDPRSIIVESLPHAPKVD